ncbi:MAG: serine hydrolase [Leptospiraceae bacterium]|nr:serine hydrolase [Leptospiraceae bacterium]
MYAQVLKKNHIAKWAALSCTLIAALLSVACEQDSIADRQLRIVPLDPPVRTYWPTNGWRVAEPGQVNMDPAGLQAMEDYAFASTGDETDRQGIRTDGVVIIKDGMLVYENYTRGYAAETRHLTWSVSKSFVNTLYGIATREGRVDIDNPAAQYYAPLRNAEHQEITLRHLLNMSSGLYWEETYEYSPLKSSVIAMLYTRGRQDMAAFVANQSMRAKPGTLVVYSSGDTNLLMGVLKQIIPAAEYAEYPWRQLFDPLGMQVTWERDASGTFVGSSYIYTSARDLAKFGYLYLNDGVWEGRELLPPGWVDFTRTPAQAYKTTPITEDNSSSTYTAQWYANTGVPYAGVPQMWPDAPEDTFAALGHWGQMLFVIPSLDMVIVRYGDDRDKTAFDANEFLKLVVAGVR